MTIIRYEKEDQKLTFADPTAWLSDPATTEEQVRKYLSFVHQWFGLERGELAEWVRTTGPLGPLGPGLSPAALLGIILAFFAKYQGRVLYLGREQGQDMERELQKLTEELYWSWRRSLG